MSVLVLGGTGFVGKNVCECLQENGIQYTVAARSTGVDLRSEEQFISLLQEAKPTCIVNCAAHVGSLNYVTKQAAEVIVDNTKMIIAMYNAIAKVCPMTVVINPIANCAYPGKADTYIEDQWWDGHLHRSVLSYGSTRRLMWSVGEAFDMQYGIRSISLMVPNMYGPYDSTDPNKAHALNALISKFVKAKMMNQSEIEIWGTGVAIREWLYAKDFGRIVVQIINELGMVGLSEPINIAQKFGLSVRELVEIIAKNFEFNGKIVYDVSKPDGAPKKVMDDCKFKKVFPEFKFTSFQEGITNTINYYQNIFPY